MAGGEKLPLIACGVVAGGTGNERWFTLPQRRGVNGADPLPEGVNQR